MVNALKLISLNRGYDPRDFTLVAFGGGGGMHAVALAGELGIRKVVVPRAADVFSAWGMLMSDLRRDYFLTRLVDLTPGNADRLQAVFDELAAAALDQFAREGIAAGQVGFRRDGNLRYANQEHGVEIELPDGPIDAAAVRGDRGLLPRRVRARVHLPARRARRVRRRPPRRRRRGRQARARAAPGHRAAARAARRRASGTSTSRPRGSTRPTIYDGELLEPGAAFAGPAIVETKGTTTVVHPGNQASVDEFGNLVISLGRPG